MLVKKKKTKKEGGTRQEGRQEGEKVFPVTLYYISDKDLLEREREKERERERERDFHLYCNFIFFTSTLSF